MARRCLAAAAALAVLLMVVGQAYAGDAEAALADFLSPPDNFTVPNIVLVSLDGALMEETWVSGFDNLINTVTGRNPNGCRIPMTWFVSKQGRDQGKCEVAQRILRLGHEFSTHSVSHSEDILTFPYDQLVDDIEGVRTWLNESCGIPASEILGYRAPRFYVNDITGRALYELGYLYDSSLPDPDFNVRPGLWSEGVELVCNTPFRQCPTWNQYPVWEVPVYRLSGADKRTDPLPSEGMSIFQRLQADYVRKKGLGVPVVIATHSNYLLNTTNTAEVIKFLDWAMEEPGTWVVTYQQYIAWLQSEPGTQMDEIMARYPCDEGGDPTDEVAASWKDDDSGSSGANGGGSDGEGGGGEGDGKGSSSPEPSPSPEEDSPSPEPES
ncbi:hypothetical protein C2E20_4168 [Micractinium conductrix]|uniref:NodB homology domain-containing protein n=1 Tax=Micractinium conductrix TaxID=554055 RepID=A0A2P6VES0_9CHLO|nr:hypothetical protein C2E20_4168 [Micractinium conductrix]|eukprot:PSC72569.1 hypothetical protein C2E20_4168 [Micractinium conductrix]